MLWSCRSRKAPTQSLRFVKYEYTVATRIMEKCTSWRLRRVHNGLDLRSSGCPLHFMGSVQVLRPDLWTPLDGITCMHHRNALPHPQLYEVRSLYMKYSDFGLGRNPFLDPTGSSSHLFSLSDHLYSVCAVSILYPASCPIPDSMFFNEKSVTIRP